LNSNIGSSSARYFTVDTTSTTITINTPANTTYGASVTFNATTGDAAGACRFSLDGASNVSMGNTSTTSWNYTNSSMTDGAHNVVFYCNDTVGNLNSTAARYFTVNTTETEEEDTGSHGGSSSSGGISLNGTVYTVNLDNGNAKQSIKVNDVIKFNLSNQEHTVRLISLLETSAIVDVSSTTQRMTLSSGVKQAVDLNGDGTNDIELTLTGVSSGMASITITKMEESKKKEITTQTAVAPIVQPVVSTEEVPTIEPITPAIAPLSTFGSNPVVAVIVVIGLAVAALVVWYKTKN